MSNRAVIELLQINNIDLSGKIIDGTSSYALRVYDNEDSAYDSGYTLESFKGKPPIEIIQLARNINSVARDIIDFAEGNSEGIEVCETFYTWDELKEF